MVGRNDPCPCGSGKKYKKCCGKNAVGDITTLVSENIDRIVEGFVKESFNTADYHALEKRNHQWQQALNPAFADSLIDTIAMETYIYIDRPNLWRNYLNKQLAQPIRPQVKNILAAWLTPVFLLAKVESQDGDLITLIDDVTKKRYLMTGSPSKKFSGNWLFGIFMPDTRKGENGLTATSSVIFIPNDKIGITQALRSKLESNITDSFELYKTFLEAVAPINHVEAAATVVKEVQAAKPVEEKQVVTESELSPFQTEILTLVQQYANEYNLSVDAFIPLLQQYLEQNEVKAKKANTVAAGAVLAGQAATTIPEGGLSKVKDVAAYYDVSASSVSKYRSQIGEFLAQ
ncbi:SEC-C domain-containing protein [Viridibacillus sp. YIM B01967]|uniref:SEC-C domain-containing protein n=1 Tax=Viridibacillus soli TaxID=2798301 RepID=A0ABS1H5N9_9BACL|nr:SEC-C metal-binding domain-containing protein [Viridibacillus soli]MBK3494624.1 SEC-C domain-containing protein [Viridibacillus soli]